MKNTCIVCDENENKKVTNFKIIVEYENPYAFGYPEICNWHETFKTIRCPNCSRKIETRK